jgi:hypothetical protein
MHSNSVCFQLTVRAIRCCSHLAQPCEVFHSRVGKTCGTIYDRSRDVWPESWHATRIRHMTGVASSTRVSHTTRVASSDQSWAYNQSCLFWPESGLLTGVGHTTKVVSSDRSRTYYQSRIFRPELDIQPEYPIQPESCLPTGVGDTTRVLSSDRSQTYDRSRAYNWSREIHAL